MLIPRKIVLCSGGTKYTVWEYLTYRIWIHNLRNTPWECYTGCIPLFAHLNIPDRSQHLWFPRHLPTYFPPLPPSLPCSLLSFPLSLSLMARVNWLLSNCGSLAWVTKYMRHNKQQTSSALQYFLFLFAIPIPRHPPHLLCGFHLSFFPLHLFFHSSWKHLRDRWAGSVSHQTNPSASNQYFLASWTSVYCCVILFLTQVHALKNRHMCFYTHPQNPHNACKHPPTCADTHQRGQPPRPHPLAFGSFSIFG